MPRAAPRSAALTALRRDPVMAKLIRRLGPLGPLRPTGRDPFAALCKAILYQQLAGKAADAIHGRFLALFPARRPTPGRLSTLHGRTLRKAGLSQQKRSYLADLARKTLAGTVRLHDLGTLEDEAVIAELTQVRGIGRWSAQMFLFTVLGRPDVFPVDDYGIVTGMRALYGKPRATKRELEAIAERWRPHRSTACLYVWRWKDGGQANPGLEPP